MLDLDADRVVGNHILIAVDPIGGTLPTHLNHDWRGVVKHKGGVDEIPDGHEAAGGIVDVGYVCVQYKRGVVVLRKLLRRGGSACDLTNKEVQTVSAMDLYLTV